MGGLLRVGGVTQPDYDARGVLVNVAHHLDLVCLFVFVRLVDADVVNPQEPGLPERTERQGACRTHFGAPTHAGR